MHNPTDMIAHTTAFVTPVVEHWLEREIAQWVHHMKDRSDDPSHHERTPLPRSYISLLYLTVVQSTTSQSVSTIIGWGRFGYHPFCVYGIRVIFNVNSSWNPFWRYFIILLLKQLRKYYIKDRLMIVLFMTSKCEEKKRIMHFTQ